MSNTEIYFLYILISLLSVIVSFHCFLVYILNEKQMSKNEKKEKNINDGVSAPTNKEGEWR